jgi:hypothetical protein
VFNVRGKSRLCESGQNCNIIERHGEKQIRMISFFSEIENKQSVAFQADRAHSNSKSEGNLGRQSQSTSHREMKEEKEFGHSLKMSEKNQKITALFPSKREESVRIYHNAVEHFHFQQLSQNKNNERRKITF